MSENTPDLTPEQLASELNRRKWKNGDFRIGALSGELVMYGSGPGWSKVYQIEDARALVLGWRAQEELAERDKATVAWSSELTKRAYAALDQVDTLQADFAALKVQIAALTEENARLGSIARSAYHNAAQIALSIRNNRCGCSHCESTATEIASIIQGHELAADLRANEIPSGVDTGRAVGTGPPKYEAEQAAPQPDLDEIEAELQPFATVADKYDPTRSVAWGDGYIVAGNPDTFCITVGQLRAIRTILAELRRLRAEPAAGTWQAIREALSSGFMTCESRRGDYFVKIAFRELEDAQRLHRLLCEPPQLSEPSEGESK